MPKFRVWLLCCFLLGTQGSFAVDSNTITGFVSDPLSLVSSPQAMGITVDGSKIYVLNSINSISIVDPAINAVTGNVSDPSNRLNNPLNIDFTPDGSKAYVVNRDSNTVSILQISNNTIIGNIASPNFSVPTDVAITPDGTKAYVTNYGNNTVSIIDVATDSVIGVVSDPGNRISGPWGIAIAPNGTKAYIVNQSSNGTVSVLTIADDTVHANVTNVFGLNDPWYVVFDSQNAQAYVTALTGGTLLAINTVTDTASSSMSLSSAYNLALTPNGSTLYVLSLDEFIQIINTTTDASTGQVSDPLSLLGSPQAMVVTPDGLYGYIIDAVASRVLILFIGAQQANLIQSSLSLAIKAKYCTPRA